MLKIGQEATATPSVPKPLGTNLLPGTATLTAGTAQAPVPTQIKVRVLFLDIKSAMYYKCMYRVVCAGKKLDKYTRSLNIPYLLDYGYKFDSHHLNPTV